MFRTPRSHREAGGLPLLLVTVWLGVWIQQISCQESGADVIHARAESTVILPAPEVMKPVEFTWYRGDMVLRQMISSYTVSPPRQSNGPRYTGRETVLPDGSLEIRILIPSDSSNYLLQVKTDNGSVTRLYTRHLLVYYDSTQIYENPFSYILTILVVAGGMFLIGAVLGSLILCGKVLLHKRRERKLTGEASHDNPNVNQEPAMDYENLRPRNHGDSLVQTSDMDSPYMELKHGDKAIYGILKR
ncbi:uncharacterized protein [Ambystoma mexicanum]|uniref:uncharacterized protein isoform X2 n=1 Tax=Ambystoma mexicanum TaxID=8296 RepID=UPI0037E9073A